MRFKKALLLSGAAALFVGATAMAAAQSSLPMVPYTAKVKQLVDRLNDVVRQELASGCVKVASNGRNEFCDKSKKKVAETHDQAAAVSDQLRARPPELRGGAERNIRKFRSHNDLVLTYQATSSNPYRDDDSVIETYVDDEANEYWIDPATDLVVQVGPAASADPTPHKTRPEDRVAVADLRQMALDLLEENVTNFAGRRSSLHPLEDNKNREIYFFRWDDFSTPLSESELPPFVQVALYADGRLASFTDTLNQ
jgi:hypothetical protein